VDLRLRPFGSAGRLAQSFAAMEQYYQREGREWERYAWVKARAVAGDADAGRALLRELAPFVYRRYLDYSAIDGLREMKALIDAEVARRDLAEHLKLGPGGIRELEFLVQLVQLIRGGREPELRRTGLLPALAAATEGGHFKPEVSRRLADAYRFLRRSENRVQMLRDEQAHALPEDAHTRARLAAALGYDDWDAYYAELARQRELVQEEFAGVLAGGRRRGASPPGEARIRSWWLALTRARARVGSGAGGGGGGRARASRRAAGARGESGGTRGQRARTRAPGARAAGAHGRGRGERASADRRGPPAAPARGGARAPHLPRAVGRAPRDARAPGRVDGGKRAAGRARDRAPRCCWTSCGIRARARILPAPGELAAGLRRQLGRGRIPIPKSCWKRSRRHARVALFRLGLMRLDRRRSADVVAEALAGVAGQVVAEVLALAQADAEAQFGRISGAAGDAGLAVLGYGSLGGAELGFQSDLDLVFVYDAELAARSTEGRRVLEGSRYFVRVAQRVVHWLTTLTRAGRLYEVDVRLRPDGAKGLLVLSLDAFAEYQRERAWLWERQALLRARFVGGDAALGARFETTRRELLARPLPGPDAIEEIVRMRERWRAELDRSDGERFDLKQGPGGLIDLEFLVQSLVLRHAHAHPDLLESRRNRNLLLALGGRGLLEAHEVEALDEAHEVLLGLALDCTLDLAARVARRSPGLAQQTDAVRAIAARYGFPCAAR
jgi:glutamate-ammonia-ligase adenylyltransferase